MSRETRRELSEKKRSAQKSFKEKFISKTEISQEQLKSFEVFHNQNEDYAIAYAEEKVNAEKELFTVIERIKQNILTNFQVKNSDDFSSSQYYKGLQEMWNAINLNNKYYNSEVTIDSKLVGSSNVAVMYATILESKNVKQDDKKKLIEVVTSRSKETSIVIIFSTNYLIKILLQNTGIVLTPVLMDKLVLITKTSETNTY